jgi:hypothetical protein
MWWTTQNVHQPHSTPNDFAAANQGELKNISTAAYLEFLANMPGGVGDMSPPGESNPNGGTGYRLTALINSWSTASTSGTGPRTELSGSNTNDFKAVNLGQLKNVAKPFYDRLHELGYDTWPLLPGQVYPWDNSPQPANDFEIANLGQIKNMFSFKSWDWVPSTEQDKDGNGLPDAWEISNFGSIGTVTAWELDPTNGVTYLQDYREGRTPNAGYVADTGEGQVALQVFTPLQ